MAYEVTATRKRPQRFETLAGQEFVVSTLTNAISLGQIAHAYLFSGPRGVGKTTTARLLAKALNCEGGPTAQPCNECSNCKEIALGVCADVIEIDGASNTSVNDVRNIKDEISFPPQHSRYKIYIIDEVHMLSNSAFNALLKTIEEPPDYVVFIFATTELQKVPATIRSRCQQFNFQLLGIETIKGLLAQTAGEIGVEAEDQALFWIAKEATGSMRDAYTLFDQVVSFSNGKITLEKIRTKLGLAGVDNINAIMAHILQGRKDEAINALFALLSRGVSVEQCIKDFADYFRALLLIRKGVDSESVLGEQPGAFPKPVLRAYSEEQLEAALAMFLQLYRDIRCSLSPRFELELAISRLNTLRYLASNTIIMEQLARMKNDLIEGKLTPTNPQLRNLPPVKAESVSAPPPPAPEAQGPAPAAPATPAAPDAGGTPVPDEASGAIHPDAASSDAASQDATSMDAGGPGAWAAAPKGPWQASGQAAPAPQSGGRVAPEPYGAPSPAGPERGRDLDNEDLGRLKRFVARTNPTLAAALKGAVALGIENDSAILTFNSKFAASIASKNINEINEAFRKGLNYGGSVVLRTVVEEEARPPVTEDPLEKMIQSYFGGRRE